MENSITKFNAVGSGKRGKLLPPPAGFPKYGYRREIPEGMSPLTVGTRKMSWRLPFILQERGYELISVEPHGQLDPYVLYDPWGNILAVWDDLPSLGTLYDFV